MERNFVALDIEGHMAHFRCIYSNIASLSYHFPPRNTVAGILAAILGLEREGRGSDGYYEVFSREKCGIAVRIITPIRKIQLTVNFLDTGSRGKVDREKIRGRGPRKQVPVEYVVAAKPFNTVKYRIYLTHKDESILSEIKEKAKNGCSVYPISLGPTYCTASFSLVEEETCSLPAEEARPDQTYPIVTVMPQTLVNLDYQTIRRWQQSGQSLKIIREENLPPDFGSGRRLLPMGGGNFYFEEAGKPVPVKLSFTEVFRVKDGYGVFM